MTDPQNPRFVDKEEWVAVKLIVEELDSMHPIRAAFDQGADALQLMLLTANDELRRRLRAVHVEALNRNAGPRRPVKP